MNNNIIFNRNKTKKIFMYSCYILLDNKTNYQDRLYLIKSSRDNEDAHFEKQYSRDLSQFIDVDDMIENLSIALKNSKEEFKNNSVKAFFEEHKIKVIDLGNKEDWKI